MATKAGKRKNSEIKFCLRGLALRRKELIFPLCKTWAIPPKLGVNNSWVPGWSNDHIWQGGK